MHRLHSRDRLQPQSSVNRGGHVQTLDCEVVEFRRGALGLYGWNLKVKVCPACEDHGYEGEDGEVYGLPGSVGARVDGREMRGVESLPGNDFIDVRGVFEEDVGETVHFAKGWETAHLGDDLRFDAGGYQLWRNGEVVW